MEHEILHDQVAKVFGGICKSSPEHLPKKTSSDASAVEQFVNDNMYTGSGSCTGEFIIGSVSKA